MQRRGRKGPTRRAMCRRQARSLRAPARLPRCQPHMRAAEMVIGVKDKYEDLKAYFAEAESRDRERLVAAFRWRRTAWIFAATVIVLERKGKRLNFSNISDSSHPPR